ncbi:MAG TPA: hypothetical protein VFR65_03355 [Nitrososphaeraceae archaeon]|nr:hypothetical protein [Nitrososphaeraceae archaeon]
MDYKTGRRSNCKKEWWNQIPLYPHLQTHAQVGIQTEGTKKSTCKHSIKRREERFKKEPERHWII